MLAEVAENLHIKFEQENLKRSRVTIEQANRWLLLWWVLRRVGSITKSREGIRKDVIYLSNIICFHISSKIRIPLDRVL